MPDEEVIRLDFGTQGTFNYRVPIYKMMKQRLVLESDVIRMEIAQEIREEVMAEVLSNTIKQLYSKLKDSAQVAELLNLPLETVLAAI